MSNTLSRDHLVPGAIVMIGPNKRINDRSWIDAIWRVEAATNSAVLLKKMSRLCGYGDIITVQISEHDWHAAEHVLEAYKSACAEVQNEYFAQAESGERERIKVAEAVKRASAPKVVVP